MRGQLSLEFLLYLAATGASLVFSLAVFEGAQGRLAPQIAQAELYALVSAVNARVGYQHSAFYAFVPSAFCKSAATTGGIVYGNVTYGFGAPIIVANEVCAGGAGSEHLDMTQYLNGTYLLS
jgi:hypothetical protein